jgi:hypothetical protein
MTLPSKYIFKNDTSQRNEPPSLREAYQDFAELILSLSEEQFLSPMNGWAPRDAVAHLIGWNGLMIEGPLSIPEGRVPSYYDDSKNDYCNINAGFTVKFSSPSKPELLAELKSSMEKFDPFISTPSDEELTADHGVIHHNGVPATIKKVINSFAGDYQYHAHRFSEWLREQKDNPI